jgi:U3 small nucleolar RNA-associated protein 18
MANLLSAANGVVEEKENRAPLEKGVLTIERLRDANLSAKAEGQVKALAFHPSPRVPLLFTASSDRRLRLFNVSTLMSMPHSHYE